ncbi:MAG: Hsp70 family protein [Anaerolineae bacterium]|nr:Hsp70 family protein [Anaerolineae bacterium]
MHIGIDFGTTNSGAGYYDGQRVHLLPIDATNPDPAVVRSTLYITRDHAFSFGRQAIETYYRENVGRPSKMVRQWVGEVEMTFAEVGTFIRDVYVMVDELTPGRLLRSLKSGLATSYEGTTVFGRYYELEELIAHFLRHIRERAEHVTGQRIDGVVLGRPVNYVGSNGQADNERAVARIREAAHRAGFDTVRFELEPVAAALHYAYLVREPQDIVVFDFGGGTLDITVMRVGDAGPPQVYATGGVGIAGDVFDQRIVAGVLLDHFGRGSTWGPDRAPFPDAYTDALANWQTVMELNRPETLHFLRWAQLTGSHPSRVRALESLLINNYAVRMYDEVEQAKIVLSTDRFATIRLQGEDMSIWQPLTRSQFEHLIDDQVRAIERCLLDTIERSGLAIADVDAVVRTGGSAQVPRFVDMLEDIFGSQRVVLSSVFSGVTSGLAISAGGGQLPGS